MKTNLKAVTSVADAIQAISEMMKEKGERPNTAAIVGYLSMMATRMLDDHAKHQDEE